MQKLQEIVAVDLFCGVGGLTHGLQKSGIDVRLGVDIDPASMHPFVTNNNTRFMLADIFDMPAKVISEAFEGGEVTLLAGCAPCQPFSTYSQKTNQIAAGHEHWNGNNDWKLVERFADLIKTVQPTIVTMENVPPLGRAPVFRYLMECLEGYSVDSKVIECRTIGLPQTRKRLVLVASKLGPITIPEFNCPEVTVRDAIGHLPPLEAGQSDQFDRLHKASKLSELNLRRIKASLPGGTWRDWPPSLKADCHVRTSGATYPSVYGRMAWDEPSPTITTQCFGYGNGRFGHPEQDRAISLREAAMLQGFPEGYSFLAKDEPVSFAKLGKLIGNAVPVTLAKIIGDMLVQHVRAMQQPRLPNDLNCNQSCSSEELAAL